MKKLFDMSILMQCKYWQLFHSNGDKILNLLTIATIMMVDERYIILIFR